jgi:hypothetical protein
MEPRLAFILAHAGSPHDRQLHPHTALLDTRKCRIAVHRIQTSLTLLGGLHTTIRTATTKAFFTKRRPTFLTKPHSITETVTWSKNRTISEKKIVGRQRTSGGELLMMLDAAIHGFEMNHDRPIIHTIAEAFEPSTATCFVSAPAITGKSWGRAATTTRGVVTMHGRHARTILIRKLLEGSTHEAPVLRSIETFRLLLFDILRHRIRCPPIRALRIRRRSLIVTTHPKKTEQKCHGNDEVGKKTMPWIYV